MSASTFHFLDPLTHIPGRELPTLLGRFVVDRWNPTMQGYEPRDPSAVLKPDFVADDRDFGNADMYITSLSSSSAQAAAAAKSLSLRGAATNEGDVHLSSTKVVMRSLKQAPPAFTALMADQDVVSSVRRLMREARVSTVWMITAVLYTSGPAHVKTNAARSTEAEAALKLTVPKEAVAAGAAAAAGLPALEAKDVDVAEVSAARQRKSGAGFEADLEGPRVFAAQYWRCEDPSFLSRLRGQMTLQGRGLQKVDAGYKGLGEGDRRGEYYDSDDGEDDDTPPLVLLRCQEVLDDED